MHGPEILVPIVMFSGLFLMIFGLRYLENKENMSLIAQGINPKVKRRNLNPSQTLKNGLMFIGAGLGLFLGLILNKTAFASFGEDTQAGIVFALIAILGGLGMLAAYFYERKNPPPSMDNNDDMSGL